MPSPPHPPSSRFQQCIWTGIALCVKHYFFCLFFFFLIYLWANFLNWFSSVLRNRNMWFTSSYFWRITAVQLICLNSIFKIFSNHERGFVLEVYEAGSLVKLSLHSAAIQTAKASLILYKKHWLMFKGGPFQAMRELGPPYGPVSSLCWVIYWEVVPHPT